MLTEADLVRLKAQAFDLLMGRIDGRHEVVRVDRIAVRPRLVSTGSFPLLNNSNSEVYRAVDVPLYEWRLRMKKRNDIAQSLLDEAAESWAADEIWESLHA